MYNIRLFQAIEIPIVSGNTLTRLFFQDQAQLRNAAVNAITLYTPGSITATPVTGSTPATLADLKKATLTLYSGDLQVIYNIPLLSLNNISNGTDPWVFELPMLDGIVISWVKSYIQFSTAPATTSTAVSFGVAYRLPNGL
jgi:hypothetical protein